MKPALLALLALAGAPAAHAVTTCTGIVKQIAIDIGGNARFYVLLTNGAGFDLPQTGDVWKVVDSMAMASKMTGEQITLTYAADKVTCAGAGLRTDVVRISTAEDSPATR